MTIEFLGTGTSTGVPQVGCRCATCMSTDPNDHRLRASAIVGLDNGRNLLIDCGPDFRQQMLRAGSPELEALLVTHSHYDHVGGLDDLRPYCAGGRHFPTYCRKDVAEDLRSRNPWSFARHLYPGVPTFDLRVIEPYKSFTLADTEVLPLNIIHGKLPILGYRIGRLGYVTDCSSMPDDTVEALRGVDTLVINSLRIEPHPTHFDLAQTLEVIERIAPRKAYLIHMSHDMGPEATVDLPHGVAFAHDGLKVEI